MTRSANFTPIFDLRTVRGLLTMYMVTFVVFGLGYTIGACELRYAEGIQQPIEHFEAWMFYLGIALPILCVGAIINMVVHLMTRSSPSNFLIVVTGIIALMQVGWNLVVLIINLSVWLKCNDGTVDAPRHPECINRDYLNSKLPDWTFMIIVISSGGLSISGCFAALMCYNANNSLSAAIQSVPYEQINSRIHNKGRKKTTHHDHDEQPRKVGEHMEHEHAPATYYKRDTGIPSDPSMLGGVSAETHIKVHDY
ncbi:MAG: hypothetical protein BVN35_14505 [Proteobacteria bacterium ST_bin11]|nr:MAG: hypothetical protein BVN35_14505 [Proteobacteria bacterium ST_bin11]